MHKFKNCIIIFLFSFTIANTGIFIDSGSSGFGAWGRYTFRDCGANCNAKNFTFDYFTKIGIELSVGIENDEVESYLPYDVSYVFQDQLKTSISYYSKSKLNKSGYRIRFTNTKIDNFSYYEPYNYSYYDYYHWEGPTYYYDYGSTTIDMNFEEYIRFDLTFFNKNSGFYMTVARESLELDLRIDIYECYGWSGDNDCDSGYYYQSYNNDQELLEIGKYFNFNGYVVGVEYKNALDNLSSFGDGNFILSFGSIFN